jgi:hypothetical protein
MSAHTPGPWSVIPTPHSTNQEFVVKVGRFHIASVDFVGNSVTEKANACLIGAAPTMLEALQHVLEYDRAGLGAIGESLVRSAIAKAGAAS